MPKNIWKPFLPVLSLTLLSAIVGFAATKPPEVTVQGPTYTAITPNKAQRVIYSLEFHQPWTSKVLPEITANLRPLGAQMDSSETHLSRIFVRRRDDQHFIAVLTTPKLMSGDYMVDFGYLRDGKFLQTASPAYLFTSVDNRGTKNLTDTGTLLWHGKPFFPIGMYHSGDDYKLLAQNGFNAIQGNATLSMGDLKKSLAQANKYGLAVEVPLDGDGQVRKNLANALEKIQKFVNDPAILSWKITDQPDIKSNASVASEVPGAYRALKAADPNHPFAVTLTNDTTLGFWSNFCDIMQIGSSAVHVAALNTDLSTAFSISRNAKSVMEPWQNLIFDVPNGKTKSDLDQQPTASQARSMIYLALTAGAKGIFWDSMHDGDDSDLTKTPLWPHIKDINAEIKTLSEPIMEGSNVPVQTTDPHVHVLGKRYQNKLYLLFTNPTAQETDVTFRVYGLKKISDGKFVNSAFTKSKDTVKVDHSIGAPNSISMKLKGLQSGTLVFDIVGK